MSEVKNALNFKERLDISALLYLKINQLEDECIKHNDIIKNLETKVDKNDIVLCITKESLQEDIKSLEYYRELIEKFEKLL